jgi:hypothetical protein
VAAIPLTGPPPRGLNQQEARTERLNSGEKGSRIEDVMESVEHHDQIHRSIGCERVQIGWLEANVHQSEPTRVVVGTLNRDGTVIKTGELNIGAAPCQLARDLSRSAAEIENAVHVIESLHSEIGETPDGQVTRIGRRKRIVTLRREYLVMELAIAGRGPRGETPAELTERTRDAAPGRRHTNMLSHPDR